MKHWVTPEFVEIRMDAEINCYSSALDITKDELNINVNTDNDVSADFAQEPNSVR